MRATSVFALEPMARLPRAYSLATARPPLAAHTAIAPPPKANATSARPPTAEMPIDRPPTAKMPIERPPTANMPIERPPTAKTQAQVWPWRRGLGRGQGAAGLLPRQPAEHLYRQADRGHDGPDTRPGPGDCPRSHIALRIFLTGATGYIGSYLAAGLLEREEPLNLLVRARSTREAERRLWMSAFRY